MQPRLLECVRFTWSHLSKLEFKVTAKSNVWVFLQSLPSCLKSVFSLFQVSKLVPRRMRTCPVVSLFYLFFSILINVAPKQCLIHSLPYTIFPLRAKRLHLKLRLSLSDSEKWPSDPVNRNEHFSSRSFTQKLLPSGVVSFPDQKNGWGKMFIKLI